MGRCNDGDAADRLAHAIRDVIDEAVRVALQSMPQPGRPLPLSVPLDSPPCLPRLLYSVAEAKELLGIGNSTLYALINEGGLECVKIGRRAFILVQSIDDFIVRRRHRS